MDATLKIQFDCSDRLEAVLKDIAEGLNALKSMPQSTTPRTRKTKAVNHAPEETPKEPVEEAKPIVAEEPKVEAKPEPVTQDEPKVEAEEVKPTPSIVIDTTEEITNADLRKAMDGCRKRLMPVEDAILHTAINNAIREEVSKYGYKSSTQLNQEQRVKFIKFCETLEIPVGDEAPY